MPPGGRAPPLRPTISGTTVDKLKQTKHVVIFVLVLVPRALVLFYLKMKENAPGGRDSPVRPNVRGLL